MINIKVLFYIFLEGNITIDISCKLLSSINELSEVIGFRIIGIFSL